jgi:lipopolysaccharide transport system permease protein
MPPIGTHTERCETVNPLASRKARPTVSPEDRTVIAKPRASRDHHLYDVIAVLFAQTIKSRYRGSKLGILWSAANPVLMALVYSAILGSQFAHYYGSIMQYGIAVYIGLALIGFFLSSTTQATASIVQAGGLLNKIRIPFEAFPISTVAAFGFQQVVGTVPIIIAISLISNHSLLHIILLIVPLAGLVMLTFGVALFLSAADVYFRDIPYIYDLVTFMLFVATPVFYPAAALHPDVLRIVSFNPLFSIIESVRTLVLTDTFPNAVQMLLSAGEGAIVLALGYVAFRAMQPKFMDLV